jgi:Predicted AAA-ATPase/PD-(D/E)XK nuclease superfamily
MAKSIIFAHPFTKSNTMLKIAYGKADFAEIRTNGYFYQDRTQFIELLEEKGTHYPAFLRPRRFGKSLFISMLHCYYGVEYKDQFQTLFGDLYIGKKPTPLANRFFILRLDFSGITTKEPQEVMHSFLQKVKSGTKDFLQTYSSYFQPNDEAVLEREHTPSGVLIDFFDLVTKRRLLDDHKVYVMVDEYDQFTNQLLSYHSREFQKVVSEDGDVRVFYEVLKSVTGLGKVSRIYLSGVAPVTLDGMGSGYNISTNISLAWPFHKMVGFEEAEVKALLLKIGLSKGTLSTVLADLRKWYNGYLFSPSAKKKVYNSTMVLYFVSQYQRSMEYPSTLLDPNIASDYKKIRQVFELIRRDPFTLPTFNTLIETQSITAELTEVFSLERGFNTSDAVSMLFYMGFLTIVERDLSSYVFKYPNYLIEKLYAQYFVALLQKTEELPIDNNPINDAVRELAKNANPQPFLDQVKAIVKLHSNRDAMQFHEGSLKAVFISLLHHQQFYYINSEPEHERRYIDIYLEAMGGYKPKYEIAFELKYLKKKDPQDVKDVLETAEAQLKKYLVAKKYIHRKNLRGFAVVVKNEDIFWKEITIP